MEPSENHEGKIVNKVYNMLLAMPSFKEMGVEIKDCDPYVEFIRGTMTIRVQYFELLVLGAKTIYKMLRCLDQ